MAGIISMIIRATRAFSGRVGRFLAMSTTRQSRQAAAEKIIADTLAKIEDLQRRQVHALAQLKELVARTRGIKDAKAQIDKI